MNYRFGPFLVFAFAVLSVVTASSSVLAEDDKLTFERDIRPIFRAHCFDCHGAEKEVKGKLDLRLVRFMLAGGESGPAIVAGDVDASYLVERVRAGEMPPGNHRVPDHQIEMLVQWVKQGAQTVRPEPSSIGPGLGVSDEERSYWAFKPLIRPAVPSVKDATRIRTPIDAFLIAKMEPAGLTFASDTDKETLIRRASLDLLGVPPTPEEVQAFLDDTSDDAWAGLINRFLDSPLYGERWGRHWLDVAGYADSEGYTNNDSSRAWAYKYRDWVIQAIGSDMPFDQFITWQLAGDELVNPPYKNMTVQEIEKLTATGFLRMAADGTSAQNDDVAREQVMIDTVKIVSTSLLGLSVGCAQCHDHRYDPISQKDYYRLRAIFEPALNPKKWKQPNSRAISLYTDEDHAKANEVEAQAQTQVTARNEKQAEFMEDVLQKELEKVDEAIRGKLEEAYKTAGDKRTEEHNELLGTNPNIRNLSTGVLYQYNQGYADKLKEMDAEIAKLRGTKPPHEYLRALTESAGEFDPTFLYYRGDYRQPQDEVTPGGVAVASPAESPFEIADNDGSLPSSGRRLAYARRLTSGRHPLVGRVLVNRFWLHHFGKGIVSTPGEFGRLGTMPTHPALLDWLADEFMASGWSLKHLHRIIMTSTVYQQESLRTAEADQLDGGNTLYSHFPVQRLDAEAIRDSILQVTNRLDGAQFGAPTMVATDTSGQVIINGDTQRRSIYLQMKRTQPISILKAFDAPAMEINCTKRETSTVATQSLMLMNSDFILNFSKAFAARLNLEANGKVDSATIENLTVAIPDAALSNSDPWSYGYGHVGDSIDGASAQVNFTEFPHFADNTWKGGDKVPDENIGWAFLSAAGGHTHSNTHNPIRRWKAPVAGKIRLGGGLSHGSDNGDGIALSVYSSRQGELTKTEAFTNQTMYEATFDVEAGETIDTIVNQKADHTSDSFGNHFWFELLDGNGNVVKKWDSSADFRGPIDLKTFEVKSSVAEQVAFGWQLAYGRKPTREDVTLSLEFISAQLEILLREGNESPFEQAMTNYCQALLTSNQFLYLE